MVFVVIFTFIVKVFFVVIMIFFLCSSFNPCINTVCVLNITALSPALFFLIVICADICVFVLVSILTPMVIMISMISMSA